MTIGRGRIGARGGWGGAALVAALLALSGCSNRVTDAGVINSVFGGGPPPDAPTPIRGLSGEKATYPNLATVPGRPTDVPTVAQREKDVTTLEQERAQSRATAKELEEKYKPMTIPPPPKVTPGKSG
ncbi:hypothetical protein [Azospirillum sp. sgz301742]